MKFNAAKGSALGKHFISLKDGESVVGVFAGDECEFGTHWKDNRSTVCPGDGCSVCKSGDKAKFRFRVNMIVVHEHNETKKPEAKILEQGWKFYKALNALNTEYPVDKNYVKILRTGKTMHDTVYTPLPTSKKPTEETLRALTDIKLLPVDPKDPFWDTSKGEGDFTDSEEVIPF